MMSISGVNTSPAQAPASSERAADVARVQKPEEEAQGRSQKPRMDQYIPEEKQGSFGRYWMGKDEEGQPKVCFDDPKRAEEAPQKPGSVPDTEGPEKGGKEEQWACDTGGVDREIEKLKEKQKQLEQRLGAETDETRSRELERQLTQVTQQLMEKDNDAYRKQHSTYTRLG